MGWNLKQKAQDHIVSISLGLIVLLLLTVWRAVPSSVWDRVSEAVPKQALWALLGLAVIAIGIQTAFALDNRRKQKLISATSNVEPPRPSLRFGLLWDEGQNPLCPADQTPLTHFMRIPSEDSDILQCAHCRSRFPIHHEEEGNLTLAQARECIQEELAERSKLAPRTDTGISN